MEYKVMDFGVGDDISVDSPQREEATESQQQGVASETSEGFANLPMGDLVKVKLEPEPSGSDRQVLLGSEMVGRFDPEDPDMNVDQWVHHIDKLGEVHGWTSYERAILAQSNLAGAARRWLLQLDDYNKTWEQWKEALRAAFPWRDFAEMLEEMVARRKAHGETMSTYYHEKLALCSRVGITGRNAVSCIIRGLPSELRANAQAARCETPQALYNNLLAWLETYRCVATQPEPVASGIGVPNKAVVDKKEKRRCYNCQKMTTHLSKNCPLPPADRCRSCGERGHMSQSCPKRRNAGDRGVGDRPSAKKDGRLLRGKALVRGRGRTWR